MINIHVCTVSSRYNESQEIEKNAYNIEVHYIETRYVKSINQQNSLQQGNQHLQEKAFL